MSPAGPSALGTLLAQRLDAVLGITLSQQSNIAAGARPDAVAQPGEAAGSSLVRDETLRHPRETVDQATAQEQPQRASAAAGPDAPRPTAEAENAGAIVSAPTVLGRAARAILALLDAYPDPAPPLRGTATLLGGPESGTPPAPGAAVHAGAAGTAAAQGLADTPPGPLAQDLAQALRRALEHSGLFYESHLGELLAGRRSPAELRREPQALLEAEGQPGSRPGAASPASQQPQAAPQASIGAGPLPQIGARAAADTVGNTPELSILHPGSHLLVRQQLETLATQAIEWRGAAWPGAGMDWHIERREPPPQADAPMPHWASRLTLRLPRLGTVQASLTLAGNSLALRLAAPEAAGRLESASPDLRARLLGSGLHVAGLSIGSEPLPEAAAAGIARAGA